METGRIPKFPIGPIPLKLWVVPDPSPRVDPPQKKVDEQKAQEIVRNKNSLINLEI